MSQNHSRQWYVKTEEGHNSGPFSDTKLQQMFQAETITLDTLKLIFTENEPVSIINGALHAFVFCALSNWVLPHVLIIPFTERKQGLHDMLCGTTVVLNTKMIPPT